MLTHSPLFAGRGCVCQQTKMSQLRATQRSFVHPDRCRWCAGLSLRRRGPLYAQHISSLTQSSTSRRAKSSPLPHCTNTSYNISKTHASCPIPDRCAAMNWQCTGNVQSEQHTIAVQGSQESSQSCRKPRERTSNEQHGRASRCLRFFSARAYSVRRRS